MRARRSTHIRERAASVAAALRAGGVQIEPGKAQLLDTRRNVVRGWLGIREALRAEGREGLAKEVEQYITRMPTPLTEREWFEQALREHARQPRRQVQLAITR